MAEERTIVILDVTDNCPFGVPTHEGSSCNFDSGEKWDIDCTTCKLPTMTRTEAIEKMAKAMYKAVW